MALPESCEEVRDLLARGEGTTFLDDLQDYIRIWARNNFREHTDAEIMAKLTEEVGEAAHWVVRRYLRDEGKQVNPGTDENLRDAIGDIVFVLLRLCNNLDLRLSEVILDASDEVLDRDYRFRA